ncbi:hypothetical protein HPP92_023780 [Vanilla planifolia]|uniref:Lipoxygenase n=1 Tax=Vanilla planifolia TaxID=51239 RepID=A0A835PNG1_VANPL|nr:hypothetical protein HPP92_023780 [Vanilla planifolia]
MAHRAFQTVPTAFSSAPGLHLRPCQLWPTTSAAKGRPVSSFSPAHGRRPGGRIRCSAAEAEETLVAVLSKKKAPTTVKAIVTVDPAVDISLSRGLDDITDLLGKSLYMELVSNELDPRTGAEKKPVGDFAHRVSHGVDEAKYVAEFLIPKDFGEIGALLITNEHHKEMFVKNIVLSLAHEKSDHVTIDCQTWIHSKFDSRLKRVFFTNKSYLPSETPSGLQELRKKELELVRGNGKGERKPFERIYDYDVYNDLGDPDSGEHLARPVLGGNKKFPYPRRCRTGRPPTKKDPKSEERSGSFYVPRDEAFAEVKQEQFTIKTLKSALHALLPYINSADDNERGFPFFTAIDSLFSEGVSVNLKKNEGWGKRFVNAIPRIVKAVSDVDDIILRFETPELMDRDKFAWFSDDEFSRQTLAGINPLCIELLREFPIVSKLDPEIYGPAESAITKEIIERQIGCFMTVEQALKEKKLFILDYHDVFLPYVHKIRTLENTTLYGSRTIFFLTPEGTLRPIAIELTRPANYPLTKQWRHVFTHLWDATSTWLWRIAKAHVGAHDSGYHQLVSHWLRTHCAAEPYVIAANRQLSALHPIYRLLAPHFRYTMEINALARQSLVNAGGIIENSFSPGKYSLELCSIAYGLQWRFDMEGLPADLIRRGMAEEDPTAEHGLRLTIKDYPYAADGLLIWSAIKEWVTDYVARYYRTPAQVADDPELQAWWWEVRNVGHGDKKDEPWWPVLDSPKSLVDVLTTIIWTVSGHHAAVNFGQYHYAGYFPNRPTVARVNVPIEEGEPPERLAEFWTKPEAELLRCFPSQSQATVVLTVLDILSSHSPDEEYLGGTFEQPWATDPVIRQAYERFSSRLREIEEIIDKRNRNTSLLNRCGAGVVPYELLKPFSSPGVTGKGVPNSVSI